MDKTIAIVGGGIGGLTCAIALAKGGLEPHVYEAAARMTAVGAGIWLPPNALQVMERLGLSDELRAVGWPLECIELYDGPHPLSSIELGAFEEEYGHTTVSIHRAELQRVLASRVPKERLHLGKRCAGVEQDAEGAVVRFEDGSEIRADVVIGADGLKSRVRRALLDVPLRYSGQACYRGIANMCLPDDLQRVCRETWGGAVRFGYSAIAADRVYWFAPILSEPNVNDDEDRRRALGEMLAAMPAPIPEIFAHTRDDAFNRLDIYDFEPLDTWHEGRVVLLGDAAHATTPNLGQGGAQAIESAYVLAKCLKESPDDLEAACCEYESLRQAKAHWITHQSHTLGRVAHYEHAAIRALRNFALRRAPDFVERRQLRRVYSLRYD